MILTVAGLFIMTTKMDGGVGCNFARQAEPFLPPTNQQGASHCSHSAALRGNLSSKEQVTHASCVLFRCRFQRTLSHY